MNSTEVDDCCSDSVAECTDSSGSRSTEGRFIRTFLARPDSFVKPREPGKRAANPRDANLKSHSWSEQVNGRANHPCPGNEEFPQTSFFFSSNL